VDSPFCWDASRTGVSPNIGPRERRVRLLAGIVSLAVALSLAWTSVEFGWPRLWRIALFPLLWSAGLGLLQARERT